MSLLSKSEYTVNSTIDFLKSIRNLKIPNKHKVISFDVKALFTNAPLDYTRNVILRKIYDNHEIDTNISKKEMKDRLIYSLHKERTFFLMETFTYNAMA